ncbi:hypothetical protein ACP3WA_25810, partial [Salmonella enterica]|uniref:hypothetical protein n=1 Tax=Salmonella enterica TaxID=28901 RepID=UPI003CF52FEF
MRDDAWTSDDFWSAALLDAVRQTTWAVQNYGVSKPSAQPKPIDRPSDIRDARERQAKLELRAMKFRDV